MFNPLNKRRQVFFAGLFGVLVLIFLIGFNNPSVSVAGCKKTYGAAASEHGCPMAAKATTTAGGQTTVPIDTPVSSLESYKKETRYTCPMHPELREKKSGKCPQCGMALVKEDFYKVYICPDKACPKASPKADKCCGKDLKLTMMSKKEYYDYLQLKDEYFCPMCADVVSDKPGKCTKCGMDLEKRTVTKVKEETSQNTSYVCPMHPDVTSDKPGTCSKCGMNLTEKKATK